MENKIITTKDNRGDITEYRELDNGKWEYRKNYEEWFGMKIDPPEEVLLKASQKGIIKSNPEPSLSLKPETTNKIIPIKKNHNSVGLSGYKSFFIGNAEWYGNKFFASLPPSSPWIIQYVLSQIIRDTSSSWKFGNAKMLEMLSQKHFLWTNISLQNIVEKTGSTRPTVIKTLKIAEERHAIISVPGAKKNVDNKIYICGIKNYVKYDNKKDNREWLFVDSPYSSQDGIIPTKLLKSVIDEVEKHQISVDGMGLVSQLFG